MGSPRCIIGKSRFFLINFFFLGTRSFLSCTISYFRSLEGKCHLQPKIVPIIFEKARKKNSIFFLLLELGQMKSGKWTRTGGRRKHILIFHVVMFVYRSGEHSAETLHIIIYKCNEAMMK